MNLLITVIGAVSLFLLFFLTAILSRIQARWAKLVPVPMIAMNRKIIEQTGNMLIHGISLTLL